jgi:hypothetical protein
VKRPHTVWLEESDADWIRTTGGFDNFSYALRVLIYDHRRRRTNLRDGHVKRVDKIIQKRKR